MSRIRPWMVVAVALGGILAGFLAGAVATSVGVEPNGGGSASARTGANTSPPAVNLLKPENHVDTGLSGDFLSNPAEGDPTPEMVWAAVQRTDQLIAEGNPTRALDILTALRNRGIADDTLSLRRAVCNEELGRLESALNEYRTLSANSRNPVLENIAGVSQARVLTNTGQHLQAHSIAASFLHQDEAVVSTSVSAEATHLLARLLLHSSRGNQSGSASSIDEVIYSNWSPSAFRIIEAFETQAAQTPEAGIAPAEPAPHGIEIISQFGDGADSYHLSIHLEQIPIPELLSRIESKIGLPIDISQTALRQLDPRKVLVSRKSITLGSLLDLLVLPCEAYWREEIGRIAVFTATELPVQDLETIKSETAIRALKYAISTWPTHELAPASWLALANLQWESGDVNTALSLYRQLLRSFPKSPVIATTLFNKGRIEIAQMQVDAALESLYQLVDGHSGDALEPAAWMHIGQILIKAEREDDAIRPLVRALTMTTNSELQANAVNSLASAYLMSDQHVAASLVLMDYRSAVQQSPHDRIAAMLGAFAKFRAASGPRKESIAVRLLQSLARLRAADLKADPIRLLAGQAWQAIGLNEEMTSLYQPVVASTQSTPLRQRMMYELGDWQRGSGALAEALDIFRKLKSQDKSSPWRRRGAEAEIQMMFESGNIKTCASLTRELLDTSGDNSERRRLLELLGRIYETQGEYSLAAQCFSGIIPSVAQTGKEDALRE